MEHYDHTKIEGKWQKKWAVDDVYQTVEDSAKPKCYVLDMFPYPSGEGLHVGHPKGYIATDVYSRHMRMQGHSVLHPMGWDAFGLPAENYALKNKIHPRVAVTKNIARFKEQLFNIGFDHDWSREVDTTDPAFYKWTQWIFLQLFKKGLAYQSKEPINWCPSCKTGLSNEDLEDTACERCGTQVEKKILPQWVLKITDYAGRMLEDLDALAWPEHIKELQRNWIGRSEGAEIEFALTAGDDKIKVFTTRPDTLFGATYVVLAPEHALLSTLRSSITNWADVAAYQHEAAQKTEIDRTNDTKEKTGVKLEGVSAINPATKQEIPVYVADYVLAGYGTGAIMAVPAHDERDFAFATKFGIAIKPVIGSADATMPYIDSGTLINSAPFDGLESEEAKTKITAFVGGKLTKTYRLKDWVFSRQRYWGEPIPIVHCSKCGAVAVPESQLPVLLPDVESYEPSGTGESPLATISEWVNTTCPTCGGPAKRETNTMPQWAGSSWYYLRFMDPKNDSALVSPEREKYWAPVDMYVGGAEHATRHLIYARFWHKFLFDIGVVSTTEPFAKLQSVGLIIAEDGRKMSKRFGNIINPDDIIEVYGADTLRVYEMFMGPFENAIAWNTNAMIGARRFIERVFRLSASVAQEDSAAVEPILHATIKKVGEDILAFKFNTAISQMMILLNAFEKEGVGKNQFSAFLQILAPFAPHLTEELWATVGHSGSIHTSTWPTFDPAKLVSDTQTVPVQINGKVRATLVLPTDISEADALQQARENPLVAKWLAEGTESRALYIAGKIINFVVDKI